MWERACSRRGPNRQQRCRGEYVQLDRRPRRPAEPGRALCAGDDHRRARLDATQCRLENGRQRSPDLRHHRWRAPGIQSHADRSRDARQRQAGHSSGALQPRCQSGPVLRRRHGVAVRTDGPGASADRRVRRRPCRSRPGAAARQPALPGALDRFPGRRIPRTDSPRRP